MTASTFPIPPTSGWHDGDETPNTQKHYLGAWRSVNDLRVQLGAERFGAFLEFVEQRIAELAVVEATYLARARSARRVG